MSDTPLLVRLRSRRTGLYVDHLCIEAANHIEELGRENNDLHGQILKLERDLAAKDYEVAQSVAMYAQITLGSRELQAKYRLLADAHGKRLLELGEANARAERQDKCLRAMIGNAEYERLMKSAAASPEPAQAPASTKDK